MLRKKNINPDNFSMLIRIFKQERKLELWAKSFSDLQFQLIHTYDICASSGMLGPKRKEGDGQVPEGFYYIEKFNPASAFYLSLGINYPNQSDRILGVKKNLGGDIFIHGNCITIGCIPMTNDKIKEIYLLAVEAKSNGQNRIPVYIFPGIMNEEGMQLLTEKANGDNTLISFWKNLKQGYDLFEEKKLALAVKVDNMGEYIF